MRLLDYMREDGLDAKAFAERLGECGPYAVKKWKYGEREPDASTIVRIKRATSERSASPTGRPSPTSTGG